MDQPIEGPDPPADLPSPVVEEVERLRPEKLRSLIEYARDRLDYLEAPTTEFIEPAEGEEIVRIDERDLYTIVVKRTVCEEGCEDCPHRPQAYVVTKDPDYDGGQHLHWVYIGDVLESDLADEE